MCKIGGVAHVLRFPAERVLRRAHIGQTLESWDFNELRALDCKSKKPLLLREQLSGAR
jgi:hypothetical protein